MQRAAWLVALDEMTQAEIAQAVGISERQLRNWRNTPEFQEAVMANCQLLLRELIAPTIRHLKRTIATAKPTDANKAAELVMKAAGLVEAKKAASNDGGADPANGHPPASFDDLRGLGAAGLDQRISDALRRPGGGQS